MKKLFLSIALLLCALLIFVNGQSSAAKSTQPSSSNNEPIEITADGSLEWNQNEKTFTAHQKAVATQKPTSIEASTLTAHYRDGKDSGMEIWRILADENVVIHSQKTTAYGQKAEYDLDKGLATMTGNNLKMIAPDQTVTARDRFEYWVTDGRLMAIGNAKISRKNAQGQTNTLDADKISATLKDNGKGQRVLHSLEATGHVIIHTQTETITGAYGIYRADTNIATLTGGVTIKRGPNILEGERAEVDMGTNTSRIFGNETGGERVRGTFYPGSEKNPQE